MLLNIQAPSEMTSVGSQTCWGSASRMDDDDDDYELFDEDEVNGEAAGERYVTGIDISDNKNKTKSEINNDNLAATIKTRQPKKKTQRKQ